MSKQLRILLSGAAALLLGAPVVQAQNAPPKGPKIAFGVPDPADFQDKNFVADSSAAAVVLYDMGSAAFRPDGGGFRLESDRTTRIKILKKAGYEAATVEVPLYRAGDRAERLLHLRGFTYSEVGGKIEKVKLDVSKAFTEERNGNVQVRKFTLPNVQEGVVIEYTYTVESDFIMNLQDWAFQREIPTRWSEFRAEIPEYLDYKMLLQGYEPLAVQTQQGGATQYQRSTARGFVAASDDASAGRAIANNQAITVNTTNYRWVMQNVPALRAEPYMTTLRDYRAQLDFQLAGTRMPGEAYRNIASTWPRINMNLRVSDEFGGALTHADFLAAAVQPLVAKYPDATARAAAVRELVMQAIKYNGANYYYASGSLKRGYDLHHGTSADVNLLLIAALRQAGLPAEPMLLSTRNNGAVNQLFPLLTQFNYVAGVLPLGDDKELLLDATDPLLPIGVLPARCLNQIGRLIPISNQADEGRWVDLTPTERHSHFQSVQLAVDAQGNLAGQVLEEYGGYIGAATRARLQQLGEKKYVTELASQHPNWEIPTYKFNAVSEVAKSLALSYELRQPAGTPGTAQELYVSPLASFGESQNPFRHEKRTYPIDLGAPIQDVITLTLTLPAGYTAELPKAVALALPNNGGRYLYSATSPTPGTVQLISRLTLDKSIYGTEEYTSLREFYRLALAKQAEALVLKKM